MNIKNYNFNGLCYSKSYSFLILPHSERPRVTSLNITTEGEVRIGEDVVMECRATGFPAPTVTWGKDGGGGGDLANGSGIIIITTTQLPLESGSYSVVSVLTVVGSDAGDSGVYTCTAMSSVGSDATSIELGLISEQATQSIHNYSIDHGQLNLVASCLSFAKTQVTSVASHSNNCWTILTPSLLCPRFHSKPHLHLHYSSYIDQPSSDP